METITEIVFKWADGREEVRYRRTKDTPAAQKLIDEVDALRAKHGDECPYFYRHVEDDSEVRR